MAQKIGRNDPCWCGSGKKYKKCHLAMADNPDADLRNFDKRLRKALSQKICLAPESFQKNCRGKIASAHTVPRNQSLRKIAKNGHLYTFTFNASSTNWKNDQPLMTIIQIGINNASTFTGFCAHHDNEIFAPLEKKIFSGTPEQCFLLYYRAFSREYYVKLAAKDAVDNALQKQDIFSQSDSDLIRTSYKLSGKQVKNQKAIYDNIIENKHFGAIEAYIIELKASPPVMCSGVFQPIQDYDGNILQDIDDIIDNPQYISVTSYFGGKYGAIVFSWLKEKDSACKRLVESLEKIRETDLTGALIRLMFEFIENLYIQPEWWDQQPQIHKDTLARRMCTANLADHKHHCLADDGLFFDPWEVHSRYWLQSGSGP